MSTDAQTKITTYDDGTFIRTAVVSDPESGRSIDVVDKDGKRLAQINIFRSNDAFMVDVIDVDDQFTERKVIGWGAGGRGTHTPTNKVAAVDFRKSKEA